jgi:hypothetical protein
MSEDVKVESLPGMGGVMSPVDEAALRAEAARKVFEASEESGPWMDDYWALIGEGWPWRQAVYMVWMAQPKEQRIPRTQGALATEVLGLTSDRQIREWREKNPAMEARIAKLAASALVKHRSEIYAALIASASKSDPRAHSDRKLALEMMGDYTPKQAISVGALMPEDVEELETEELVALAQVPGEREIVEGDDAGE